MKAPPTVRAAWHGPVYAETPPSEGSQAANGVRLKIGSFAVPRFESEPSHFDTIFPRPPGGRPVQAFWDAARFVLRSRGLLGLLLVANVAGMVYGWGYYVAVGQFEPGNLHCTAPAGPHCTPWWSWPLVADSPNAVFLFFVAVLVARLFGARHRLLDGTAFVLNVYVGLWTTMTFLAFPADMGTWRWGSTNNILFFTHLGMPLQALLLVPRMRGDLWSRRELALVATGLAAYLFVDYLGPVWHPAPWLHPADLVLHIGSPLLMVAAFVAWRVLTHHQKARGAVPP